MRALPGRPRSRACPPAPRAARPRRSCWPTSSTTTCSHRSMTIPMLCSTSSTVRSRSSRSARIRSAELADLGVVEPAGRLVEHQEARALEDGAGELDALERPVREAGGGMVGHLRRAAGARAPRRPRRAGGARRAETPRRHSALPRKPGGVAAVGPEHHVLAHAHRREQAEVLEAARDAERRDLVRGAGEQVLAVEGDAARLGRVEAADAVEERGLAGAVGADQPADRAGLDREATARPARSRRRSGRSASRCREAPLSLLSSAQARVALEAPPAAQDTRSPGVSCTKRCAAAGGSHPGRRADAARRHYVDGERVDMRAIAADLGVGRATLYRWFGSRERLLGEVIARETEGYFAHVRTRVRGRGAPALLETFDRINRGPRACGRPAPLRRAGARGRAAHAHLERGAGRAGRRWRRSRR